MLVKVLIIGLFAPLGLWVLVWGLPRAKAHRRPLQWIVGILAMGLSLIAWPPIIIYLSKFDLEMVWIVVLAAPLYTFGWGANAVRQSDSSFWW